MSPVDYHPQSRTCRPRLPHGITSTALAGREARLATSQTGGSSRGGASPFAAAAQACVRWTSSILILGDELPRAAFGSVASGSAAGASAAARSGPRGFTLATPLIGAETMSPVAISTAPEERAPSSPRSHASNRMSPPPLLDGFTSLERKTQVRPSGAGASSSRPKATMRLGGYPPEY